MTFSDIKLDLMKDWGDDYSTYEHDGRYLYKLTGTMKYTGTRALDSVSVEASCTEIRIDKYNEKVPKEDCALSLKGSVTFGCDGSHFYAVQPGESRTFEYRFSSDNELEDPAIKVNGASVLEDGVTKYYAKEGDFTVQFTKGPIDIYGTGSATVKNNTSKLFDQVEVIYYRIDSNGASMRGNTFIENVRPGGEEIITELRDEGVVESGILAMKCTEYNMYPAVSVDKEFSFTTSTDSNGDPVVKLTNKTGKYLSAATVRATWVDGDGIVRADEETEWTLRPDEEREFTFEYEGRDGVKDFRVFDVEYSVDEAKEKQKAEASSSSSASTSASSSSKSS